ncbi:MAG: hypothetical protein ACE5MM_09885, partial [Nitrospiraceae bacterium]
HDMLGTGEHRRGEQAEGEREEEGEYSELHGTPMPRSAGICTAMILNLPMLQSPSPLWQIAPTPKDSWPGYHDTISCSFLLSCVSHGDIARAVIISDFDSSGSCGDGWCEVVLGEARVGRLGGGSIV